jgi:hypothetical protein
VPTDSAAMDLTAPCPVCGFYRDTPNHVHGCNPRPDPGACGDPECYVLHRDPAHPIHPHERPHRHLVTRHTHPEWHGHCDPDVPGYKPCGQSHWHFWWRHAHA